MRQDEADSIVEVLKRLAPSESARIDLAIKKQGKSLLCQDGKQTPIQWSIDKSLKYAGKVSLNCRLPSVSLNIIRLDTAPVNQHTNPVFERGKVPNWLERYSRLIIQEQAHLHVYVSGFPRLDWAVPLSDIPSFNVGKFEQIGDIAKVIIQFAQYIKIENELTIQTPLL